MGTQVKVASLPQCDFCGSTAHYDGATTYGPWGYMCDAHFKAYGLGLGTGVGQELILEDRNEHLRSLLHSTDRDSDCIDGL